MKIRNKTLRVQKKSIEMLRRKERAVKEARMKYQFRFSAKDDSDEQRNRKIEIK